jgi:hypothetical protein
MRSPKEDVALIRVAGFWQDDRDPILNAVTLLLMYAKGRHKPLVRLHKLADAIEGRDAAKAAKQFEGLVAEVERTLPKYPDIVGTVNMMSEMSDEDFARVDELME